MTGSTLSLADALRRLARDRDPQAWAAIVGLAGADLHATAARLCGSAALADDAVQEALLQVRDGARLFVARSADPEADARAWLRRVAANAALQLLRRRARRARAEARTPSAPAGPSPEQAVDAADVAAVLRAELARLPERTRAAIVLHHLHDHGYEQVAAALRIPIGTAKTLVHRGLGVLRDRLVRRGLATVGAVVAAVHDLPAASSPATAAPAAWTTLLQAPAVSSLPTITTGAAAMAVKSVLLVLVIAALPLAPLLRSQEAPTPAGTAHAGGSLPAPADRAGSIADGTVEGATADPAAPAARRGSVRQWSGWEWTRVPTPAGGDGPLVVTLRSELPDDVAYRFPLRPELTDESRIQALVGQQLHPARVVGLARADGSRGCEIRLQLAIDGVDPAARIDGIGGRFGMWWPMTQDIAVGLWTENAQGDGRQNLLNVGRQVDLVASAVEGGTTVCTIAGDLPEGDMLYAQLSDRRFVPWVREAVADGRATYRVPHADVRELILRHVIRRAPVLLPVSFGDLTAR